MSGAKYDMLLAQPHLVPVLAVSLRGSGFMAQLEPGGTVPSLLGTLEYTD